MSCQIRLTACIKEIEAIRRCLFPTDDHRGTDSWLQQCKIAPSPTGDIIALANERKIVVLTSKWDYESSLNYFYITYSGNIHEYDKVKALVCLPIVDLNGKTLVGSDWTCILVGFDSGHVRCYTDTCELLFEGQFHAENITTIKCQSQHNPRPDISPSLYPEEIYVQYQSTMCVISGPELCMILKKNRSELQKDGISDISPIIVPKKWGFQDQSVINDSAVVGLNFSSFFDHLVTVSTCGGFDVRYRSMPPHNRLVLAAGSKPFLGYHYASEGTVQPVLSDVAKAVASRLKSALPDWFTGTKSQPEKRISLAMQPSEPMGYRFGLCDLERTSTDLILSPDRKLAAVCDASGRVLLVDSFRGITLKIFKGYRDAQCSFTQVLEEKKSRNRSGDKVANFLNIYSPKKGTLEIFSVQLGTRIATFTASKNSRLLYINYGLMGFTSTVKSKYKCQYTTIFIDNDGQVKEISIPFHFALSEKNNKRVRDIHLYKKLRHLVKCDEVEEEKLLSEALNTCKELKTLEFQSQTVDMLLSTKSIPATVSLQCVQYYVENLTEEGEHLKVKCENASKLLTLYLFVANLSDDDIKNGDFVQQDNNLHADEKDMKNLHTLSDLSNMNHSTKLCKVHVSFSDNTSLSPSEFLSIFDISKCDGICLKENVDETILYKSSEVLFKPYITTNHNLVELEENIIETGLPTKNLFNMLVNYWVNRSLHISICLEKEMYNLSKLMNTLARTGDKNDIRTEYSQISPFWSGVRDLLTNSARPFPALIAAIICKGVAQSIEADSQSDESTGLDDSIEVWTQETVKWSMLIGKLEDVSLLDIVISTDITVHDCPLPKLEFDKTDVSLKYILEKGKGSVTELASQWLTSTGINPRNLVVNEQLQSDQNSDSSDSSDSYVPMGDDLSNEEIFKQINLLKTKFPYSMKACSLLANMAWEYAVAWQRNIQNLENLEAAVKCLSFIQDLKIKQGLYQLVWNTHLKIVTENACKLINKVGILPKERLCRQDTGLSDSQITQFMRISYDFFYSFVDAAYDSYSAPKTILTFENIWENGGQALVELAVQQREVNYGLLLVHNQLSMVLELLTMFPIKCSKPINNLFDATIVNVFFIDLQTSGEVAFNKTDMKLNGCREQFLTTMIAASLESITVEDSGKVHCLDHVKCMDKCIDLARIWTLDHDSLKRYQVVQLFSRSYDNVANELFPTITNKEELGKSLMRIAAKKLGQFLSSSPNVRDNFTALTPAVSRYIGSLGGERCFPSPLIQITYLATLALRSISEEQPEFKLAMALVDACKNLEAIHL